MVTLKIQSMEIITNIDGVELLLNTEELIQFNISRYFPLFPKNIFFLGVRNNTRAPIKAEYQGVEYVKHYACICAPEAQSANYARIHVYEKVIYR